MSNEQNHQNDVNLLLMTVTRTGSLHIVRAQRHPIRHVLVRQPHSRHTKFWRWQAVNTQHLVFWGVKPLSYARHQSIIPSMHQHSPWLTLQLREEVLQRMDICKSKATKPFRQPLRQADCEAKSRKEAGP